VSHKTALHLYTAQRDAKHKFFKFNFGFFLRHSVPELIVLVKQSRAILEKLKDLGVRISVQQDDAVLPVGAMEGIKNVARRSSSSGEQP